MKKSTLYYFIIAMLFVAACQKVDMNSKPGAVKMHTMLTSDSINFNVSLKTASYLASLTNKEIKGVESVVSPEKDTLMYFVNFKEGWMVIAADKRVDPVLASSEKGSLSSAKMDNAGVAIWFNNAAGRLAALKQNGKSVKYDEETLTRWLLIEKSAYLSKDNINRYKTKRKVSKLKSASEIIGMVFAKRFVSMTTAAAPVIQHGHLLSTEWGQGGDNWPYSGWNVNTPYAWDNTRNNYYHCPTGCVAVSMSQILYYLHYQLNKPTGLYHTVSSTGYIYDSNNYNVSFSKSNYVDPSPRWDQMAHNFFDINTSYVADLMADVGNRVGMTYSLTSSGAFPSTSAFNSFGITCLANNYNSSYVLSELDNNIPVLVSAYAHSYTTGILWWKETHYDDGHSWVIDGYQKQGTSYIYNYVWDLLSYDPMYDNPDPNNPYVESISYDDGNAMGLYDSKTESDANNYYSTFLLMNWGWDGDSDNVIFSIYPTGADAPWNVNGHYFQYQQSMIWDFR